VDLCILDLDMKNLYISYLIIQALESRLRNEDNLSTRNAESEIENTALLHKENRL
jgi:hypothetical protein